MLKSNFLILLATFLVATVARAESVCVSDTCFVDKTELGTDLVPLVGVGTYEYYFFDLYTAAWYAPVGKEFPLQEDKPQKLLIHYYHDIKASDLIAAAEDFLLRQKVSLAPFQERLHALNKAYVDVKDGDEYSLEYVPGKGLSLLLNKIVRTTIPGKDFADFYLGIWLHPNASLSKSLRAKLLALKD